MVASAYCDILGAFGSPHDICGGFCAGPFYLHFILMVVAKSRDSEKIKIDLYLRTDLLYLICVIGG